MRLSNGSRLSSNHRRARACAGVFLLLATLSFALSGCGWTPLYADSETGPASAALRSIHVEPIAQRIGQHLEWALRTGLNPTGIATPERYDLRTTLAVSRASLGIQLQGLATRDRVDAVATITLVNLKTGATLLSDSIHSESDFDILPNGYATKVAEDDADRRTVRELSQAILLRLTLFLQRHGGAHGA